MRTPKVLSSAEEHAATLDELNVLLEEGDRLDAAVRDRVELLLLLIEDYERRHVEPLVPATPVEAIAFRMEQQGLATRDLIPYLGSASRVSEVLSGRRGLSISMIRALHEGLGIPASVLIADPQMPTQKARRVLGDVGQLMKRRGWVPSTSADVISAYLAAAQHLRNATAFRRSARHGKANDDAVEAWTSRVYHVAKAMSESLPSTPVDYDVLFSEVVKLSWANEGPRLAVEFLRRHGVPVVIEPELPGMHLDGLTIIEPDFVAVGMTIRFDRLDAFWFTLAHELAHVIHRHGRGTGMFVDDLEVPAGDHDEQRADEMARERLIPADAWRRSPASRVRSREAAEHLAHELRIHPAIVAGRIRFESRSYRVLSNMVGTGEVRRLFPEVVWE